MARLRYFPFSSLNDDQERTPPPGRYRFIERGRPLPASFRAMRPYSPPSFNPTQSTAAFPSIPFTSVDQASGPHQPVTSWSARFDGHEDSSIKVPHEAKQVSASRRESQCAHEQNISQDVVMLDAEVEVGVRNDDNPHFIETSSDALHHHKHSSVRLSRVDLRSPLTLFHRCRL